MKMNYPKYIPNNQIWYTTVDGKVVHLWPAANPTYKIVSNTYKNGYGILRFDEDLTELPVGFLWTGLWTSFLQKVIQRAS